MMIADALCTDLMVDLMFYPPQIGYYDNILKQPIIEANITITSFIYIIETLFLIGYIDIFRIS